MDMNQDLPRVNRQDDIFTAYDRRNAPEQPAAVGKIDVEEGELEFQPQFEAPKLELPKAKQDEIEPESAHEMPGLKAFNVTQLISKEMFDIAEYFLGRPLTADEKLTGMVGKAEEETIRKQSRDQEVLESLARLVKMANKHEEEDAQKMLKRDRNAAQHAANISLPDDDDEDDDQGNAAADSDDDSDEKFVSFAQHAPPIQISAMASSPSKSESGSQSLIDQTIAEVNDMQESLREIEEELFGSPSSPERAHYLGDDALIDKGLLAADSAIPQPAFDPSKRYTGDEIKEIIRSLREANTDLKVQWDRQTRGQSRAVKDKTKPLLWMNYSSLKKQELETHMKNAWQDLQVRRAQMIEAQKAGPASAPLRPGLREKKGQGVRPDNVVEQPVVPSKREYKKRDLVPFGPKWLTDSRALKEGNELIILRQTDRGHLNKHPNRIVSAGMKVCLQELLADRPMPTELLTDEEKEWLQWMMEDGKMVYKQKPQTPLKIVRTPKQIKDRLSILYGEIAQGPNDNPDVKKEFKNLYNQASLMGLLNKAQIENLQEFIKTF